MYHLAFARMDAVHQARNTALTFSTIFMENILENYFFTASEMKFSINKTNMTLMKGREDEDVIATDQNDSLLKLSI